LLIRRVIYPVFYLSFILVLIFSNQCVAQLSSAAAPNPSSVCHVNSALPQIQVSGTVRDPLEGVINSAIVRFTCGDFVSEARTTPNGRYSIDLPPGIYQVTASATGFEPLAQEAFSAGGTAPVLDCQSLWTYCHWIFHGSAGLRFLSSAAMVRWVPV
jgi:hypothetical protein